MVKIVFIFNPEAEFLLLSTLRAKWKREWAHVHLLRSKEELDTLPRPWPRLSQGSECLLLASNLEIVPGIRDALRMPWLDLGGRKGAKGVDRENWMCTDTGQERTSVFSSETFHSRPGWAAHVFESDFSCWVLVHSLSLGLVGLYFLVRNTCQLPLQSTAVLMPPVS